MLITLSLIWLAELLPGCVFNRHSASPPPTQAAAAVKQIYIVNHGKHTGIILHKQDIPVSAWPEQQDFPGATYLEVGWGDKDYYQIPEPHVGILLKAVLIPTPAVLHVVGFSQAPAYYFFGSELIRLQLTEADFENLIRYIGSSFARNRNERAFPLRKGLYGQSFFYLSKENYHLLKTCNVWVANALIASGKPVNPWFSVTAGGLMSQAQAFGTIIRQ